MTAQQRRVAAVDIGSNSVRLLIADVTGSPEAPNIVERIREESHVTRLSEHVDRRGILLPQAITRTRNVLVDYRAAAEQAGAVVVLATATSAVRDADNGEAFLGEVEYSYGFRTRLLSGADEAQMSWAGATSDADLAQRTAAGRWALMDIGGGSTEIVLVEDGTIRDHHSFQLGCVRLTERHLEASDPPAAENLAAARRTVASQLQERFPDSPQVPRIIGVAGSSTTLVARILGIEPYDPDRIHLQEIEREAIEAELELAAALTVSDRARLPGMSPRRAPVILAGYCIATEILRHFRTGTMVASERDILDGIALEAFREAIRDDLEELPTPHGRTPC